MTVINWGTFHVSGGWPGADISALCRKLEEVAPRFPISTRLTPHITFTLLGERVNIHENAVGPALLEIASRLTAENLRVVRGAGGGRVLSYKEESVPGAFIYFPSDRKKRK